SSIVEDHPSGYPRLAALLCTDDNLMLYHRFTYLQSRLLLHKQDEIRELERKLDRMDKADATKAPEILKSRELDDKNVGKRLELLSAIETKFNEYATLLTNARHITSFNNPTDEDYQSVRTYFDKGTPLREMESYIYHEEDILSLKVEIENAWLDVWLDKKIEELLDKYVLHTKYGREFLKKTNPTKAGVILYSRGHLNKFKITIILGMIMIHFVVPVYVLWYMARLPETNSSTAVSVAILLIFTCALSLVLSQLTRAKRHEILASAAAYCAVLVVFIGNAGQPPVAPSSGQPAPTGPEVPI
ncbi:hypothetical protein DL95DRAFT_482877, partial [Leptodontidium sp. 2 PMI_412]